jgi:hypothetical protein
MPYPFDKAHHAKGAGMEEQPHESPAEQPAATADGQPKFFKSMNGMIAGATALIIALSGLAATWDKIFGDKPDTKQESASKTQDRLPVEDVPTITAKETGTLFVASERPKIYTGDLYADGKFEGGAMSLKHNGENWILTADKAYEYEQLSSTDKDNILAFNAEYGSYLRWPIDGGEVQESVDRKKSWSRYAKVAASEPSSN